MPHFGFLCIERCSTLRKPGDVICPVCKAVNRGVAKRCDQCGNWLLDTYHPPKKVEELSSEEKQKLILRKPLLRRFWFLILIFALGLIIISGGIKTVSDFFIVLFLTSAYLLVVGLIKPSEVIRWGSQSKRSTVLKVYLSLSIAALISVGITAQPIATPTITSVSQQTPEEFKANCISLPYDDLARYTEKYVGTNITSRGQIIQIVESGNNVVLRVNVTEGSYGIWSDTVWINYSFKPEEGHLLDNDIIQFWGTVKDRKSYTSIYFIDNIQYK
jgi:hypothetical protein